MSAPVAGLAEILRDVRTASENIKVAEIDRKVVAGLESKYESLESSVNELWKKTGRPGAIGDAYETDERKSAIGMCRARRALTTPKIDANVTDDYEPSSSEISEALIARKALSQYLRHGDVNKISDPQYRKSLSAFSFGGTGFLLPPETANRILSCLVTPTDLAGLVDRITISSGSIKFFIDNARMGLGAWACEASCFSNNPQPDLSEGLGELEIKAETIRMVVCATPDLLQDAATNFETWILRKISDGMRVTINQAILLGDGVGKPMGLLNPHSGIPICDAASATAPGTFTWQDLVALKFDLPQQFWDGAVYIMNQRTAGLLMTMSSTDGRPLLGGLPLRCRASRSRDRRS